jgi:hypothetical protein
MRRRGAFIGLVAAVMGFAVASGLLVRGRRRRSTAGALSSHSALASPSPPARAAEAVPPPTTPNAAPPAPSGKAASGLRVEADVAGADVFVDREFKGRAPLTIGGVAAGPHRLNVSAEGYDGYAETIDVTGRAQTVAVRLKDVKLAAGVDVVHKHGMGSCRGRLSATPAGLRYEASKAEDAFDVPLASVERLAVDYPKKTLAAKLRGGRTYNFTEPSGNADALLAFQQAVTKAQERMASGRQ